ncbi:signal peptidase I [Myxococcota bacterium]|nr:signal peptidase I [Myxococcota bacterium]
MNSRNSDDFDEKSRNDGSEWTEKKSDGRELGEPARGALREHLITLLLAVVVALAIRAVIVEPFRIPSGSMLPTLLIGDHLFVNRFIYGIDLPFLDFRLPGLRKPRRGDVVVFTVAKRGSETFPVDSRPGFSREQFVKRIMGLPGDRLEYRDGALHVNGVRIEDRLTGDVFVDEEGQTLSVHETVLPDRRFRTVDDPDAEGPPWNSIQVPPGRYFVLGDNRDYSKDSRVWGTVREEEIRGPAFLIYWSWDWDGNWGELLNPFIWPRLLDEQMRWNRLGASIE